MKSFKSLITLAKYSASSVISMLLDLGLFTLILQLVQQSAGPFAELIATIAARACSSFFNFNANKAAVFKKSGDYKKSIIRYYCLCIPQALASAGLVSLINHHISLSFPMIATVIKFVVDTALFFISYQIQKRWVFK